MDPNRHATTKPTRLSATLLLLSALLLPLAAGACTHEYKTYHSPEVGKSWELGGVKVAVEIAKDGPARARGLMFRQSMPADHGMLFVYPEPRVLRFWMKNTSIPLAIAFIEETADGKGRIVNVEEMQPYVESGTVSLGPVRLALEMNQGWFAKHGLKAGDVVELPEWVRDIVASEDS